MVEELKYKRILLKVSGEALLGSKEFGIDVSPFNKLLQKLKKQKI